MEDSVASLGYVGSPLPTGYWAILRAYIPESQAGTHGWDEVVLDGCLHTPVLVALALQLQTILGEQLASDDQAADVIDIGTVISLGDGIARVYGCEA